MIKSNKKEPMTSKPFPKLMIAPSTGNIALFSDNKNAIYIHNGREGNSAIIGERLVEVDMAHWKDFNGLVTLENI